MIPLFLLVFCEIRPQLAPHVNQAVANVDPFPLSTDGSRRAERRSEDASEADDG